MVFIVSTRADWVSFVSIKANVNLCSIMSDGRFTDSIVSTDTKGFADYILKIIKINSNPYEDWITEFKKFYDDRKLPKHHLTINFWRVKSQ